jgi:hypothetical protein
VPGVEVNPQTNRPIEQPVSVDPTLPAIIPDVEPIPGMELEVAVGGVGAFTGGMDGALKPFARIRTTTPLPIFDQKNAKWWPRAFVRADFTGLPGRALNVVDITTYNAVEVTLGLSQPAFQNKYQRLGFYGEGGFATRLQGGEQYAPLNKTVKWGAGGIIIEQKQGKAWVKVGLGADQRLSEDYSYVFAVLVSGSVRLWTEDVGALKGVGISIGGDASLGLTSSYPGAPQTTHDLVRVYIALSR